MKISVVKSIFSKFPGYKLHLDKSGLHNACSPRNFRTAFLWINSAQLFQLFSQINFRMLLEDTTLSFVVFAFHFCLGVFSFRAPWCKM